MRHKIEFVEHINEDEEFLYVVLEIDGNKFVLDKSDVWNLDCLSETAFNKMPDWSRYDKIPETVIKAGMEVEEATMPKVNRKVVKE